MTSVEEKRQFLDDVVEALTGPIEGASSSDVGIQEQLKRAAVEFDTRTAKAFGKALVEALCESPGNLRLLEALLILGLAHPNVVKRYGVSIPQEGRRLALLLEQAGEPERARSLLDLLVHSMPGERGLEQELGRHMRRNGEADVVVDRCMQQAEALIAQGRIEEAIPWLQEILLQDRNRRDVARMIRDLRYQGLQKRARSRRARFIALLCLLVSAALAGVAVREHGLIGEFAALPAAIPGDLAAHRRRLQDVEAFGERAVVWTGMFRAETERSELRREIDRLAAHEAQLAKERREQQEQDRIRAEAAREQGLGAVERGELQEALSHFQEAFALSAPNWEHRPRLVADMQAIEAWLERSER